RQSKMSTAFAALPAVGFALLPKLTCPACWPAYAALLSALGLGFVDYTPYLLPLTGVFLAVTLAALSYGAKSRRGYRPLLLGTFASAIVILGKFFFDSDPALYTGVGLLVAAALWNSWPLRRSGCGACGPMSQGDVEPATRR
ncbi:MAG: MerC family mercury resistance protein, partial [Burkholderiales bacterium]